MWEVWLYKTIIAFISINGLCFVFKDFLNVWNKQKQDNIKKISRFRKIINGLVVSMIPFARWVFVGMVLLLILLTPIYKEQLKKEGKENE